MPEETPAESRITTGRDGDIFLIGFDPFSLREPFRTKPDLLTGDEFGPAEAVQRKLAQTADAAEGLKSFVERRKAKFTSQ